MDNGKIPEKDYRKLYSAFVNAISNSEEIREIIEDLKERNKLNSISIFALIVKLEELLNSSSLPEKENLPETEKEEERKVKKAVNEEYIDGEKLSLNEKAFETYCRKKFDEQKWLKENRLKF